MTLMSSLHGVLGPEFSGLRNEWETCENDHNNSERHSLW